MIRPIDLLTYRPDSRLRPSSWRWDLARYFRDRSYDDPNVDHPDLDVVAAYRLMFVVEGERTETDRLSKLLSLPTSQTDAYAFHTRAILARDTDIPGNDPDSDYPMCGPLTADAMAKAQLEAFVLAGKSAEHISKVTGLDPSAVTQYEKWWFDVRDRLANPGWVATSVIGSLQQGPPSMLLPSLIRAYGYYTKSSRIVRAVTGLFDAPSARAKAKDPAQYFAADAVFSGSLKAALAVRMMPLGRRTYARVMELHHAAMDVALKSGQDAGTEDANTFREASARLFKQLDRKYHEAPIETPESPPVPRLVQHVDQVG